MELKNTEEIAARTKVASDMADNYAVQLGVQPMYAVSRHWPGYQRAFDSWQRAIWTWADAGAADKKSRWRQYLLEHRYLLPPDKASSLSVTKLDVERALQTYLLRRANFLGRPANRLKNQAAWWKRQAGFLHLAAQLNDDDVFKRVVQLARKSDLPGGSRELLDWLRLFWLSGCFWACTNNGIAAIITRHSETGGSYSEGSVRNAISALKLWRPTKPLYWGLDKDNGLVPLR